MVVAVVQLLLLAMRSTWTGKLRSRCGYSPIQPWQQSLHLQLLLLLILVLVEFRNLCFQPC